MQKRIILSFIMVICTFAATLNSAESLWATSAEAQKQEAEDSLKDVNNQIEDLENQQEETKDKIKEVQAQLEKLLKEQNQLQKEIQDNERKMEQTAVELEMAKNKAQEQYETMKIRIQYMYENSTGESLIEAIIESDGLLDMLKRVEYVLEVHRSDRKLTKEYQKTVAFVEEKQIALEQDQDELLFKQEAYLGRQSEIETVILGLTEEQNSYTSQLASAKEQAAFYRETIKKQDEIIRQEQLEAEKEQAENNAGNMGSVNTGAGSGNKPGGENSKPGSSNGNMSSGNENVTGMDIVNFARQFVGNPYVWGGNSLTNGCDCSGFIHLVYKNFGYTVPRYSMSFLNVGTPVEYEDMQPGDIVIYERLNGIGHVAIYMGDGKIVEAQSSKAGITDNRSVDCRGIIGIRRIIN
jgi:cell wall-associated NlpC family hydrolase